MRPLDSLCVELSREGQRVERTMQALKAIEPLEVEHPVLKRITERARAALAADRRDFDSRLAFASSWLQVAEAIDLAPPTCEHNDDAT